MITILKKRYVGKRKTFIVFQVTNNTSTLTHSHITNGPRWHAHTFTINTRNTHKSTHAHILRHYLRQNPSLKRSRSLVRKNFVSEKYSPCETPMYVQPVEQNGSILWDERFSISTWWSSRAGGSVLEDGAITIVRYRDASFVKEDTCVYIHDTRIGENSRALCLDARVRIRRLPLNSLAIGSFPSAFSFRDTRTFLLALEHLESSPSGLASSLLLDATRFADPETTLLNLWWH